MKLQYSILSLFCCLSFSAFAQLGHRPASLNDKLPIGVAKSELSDFPNEGWHQKNNLPDGRWATGPVFVPVCASTTDDGNIFLFGGANDNFEYTAVNQAFNLSSNSWSDKAPLPSARGQITPIYMDGKVYVIGGYFDAFQGANTTLMYDVESDSWTEGADLPIPVGDYACGVYDGRIYVVGGSFTNDFYNAVQIYTPATDTWQVGTEKPGTAVGGGRMAIAGNHIVMVGGYDPITNGPIAEAHLGVIDPDDPTVIVWSALADYPGGAMSRLAAGVAPQDTDYVYFAGGDPFSTGEFASDLCYAYNLISDEWEEGPDMIHGVNNVVSLAGFVHDGKKYLATMGGIDNFEVASWNEWLDLGPAEADPNTLLAAVEDVDAAGCEGTLEAIATGGTPPYTYMWDDPSMQTSQVATGLCAGTYSVQITDADGCTATSSAEVNVLSGIGEGGTAQEWSLYPNPTSGKLVLKNMPLGKSSRLILTDFVGHRVMEIYLGMVAPDEVLDMDLTALPNGMYIVQLIEDETLVSSQRVIKF